MKLTKAMKRREITRTVNNIVYCMQGYTGSDYDESLGKIYIKKLVRMLEKEGLIQ